MSSNFSYVHQAHSYYITIRLFCPYMYIWVTTKDNERNRTSPKSCYLIMNSTPDLYYSHEASSRVLALILSWKHLKHDRVSLRVQWVNSFYIYLNLCKLINARLWYSDCYDYVKSLLDISTTMCYSFYSYHNYIWVLLALTFSLLPSFAPSLLVIRKTRILLVLNNSYNNQ